MIKKLLLVACVVAAPTLTVAFAPTKGNTKKISNEIIEVVIRKKLKQVKKEIITFFAHYVIFYNKTKK